MPTRIDIPKALLQELYYTQRLTQREIAAKLGCHQQTICRKKELGMETYTAGDQTRLEIPCDELRALYIGQELTIEEIAAHYNCCPMTISRFKARR